MLPVHRMVARQHRPLVELLFLSRQQRATSILSHGLSSTYIQSCTLHGTASRSAHRHAPTLLLLSARPCSHSPQPPLLLRRSFASTASSSDSKQKPDGEQQSERDEQKQQRDEQDPSGDEPYAEVHDGRAKLRRILRGIGVGVLLFGSFGAGFALSSRGARVHSDRTTPRSWGEVFTDISDGFHDWGTNLLGTADTPLLPPPTLDPFNRKPRTLVLGLEDVLTHHDWDRFTSHLLQQRPYLHELLEGAVRQGWEVVLFSSKPQLEVETDIVHIDKSGLLRHRLFYDQTNMKNYRLVKDLSRLGRERTRVVVVDHDGSMYKGWEDNVYTVRRWRGPNEAEDPKGAEAAQLAAASGKGLGAADKELREVLRVLEKIQRYNVYDVRRVVARHAAGERELFVEEEELAEQARRGLQERQSKQLRVRQWEDASPAAGKSEGGWLSALGSLFSRAGTTGKKLTSAGPNDEQS